MSTLTTQGRSFEFEVGPWRSVVRRLAAPLSGSTEWLEYEGTTFGHALWPGAYAVELDVSGPAGRLRAFSLRLYDEAGDEWSLRTGVPGSASLDPPLRGGFTDGLGEFLGPDIFGGKPIQVRFVIRDITESSARFEQYFSEDDGKTFELNLITDDTRPASTVHLA